MVQKQPVSAIKQRQSETRLVVCGEGFGQGYVWPRNEKADLASRGLGTDL
jgi:hypothetical protein